MKAEKLKSGHYRVRVYLGKDSDGKQRFKSVTADTKVEALRKARMVDYRITDSITVQDAVGKYLTLKERVLSPSTFRSYAGIFRNHIDGQIIGSIRLSDLTGPKVQGWVSELSGKVSPKTVKNCYGLLSAALDTFAPELHFRVKLPQRMRPEITTPPTLDVLKVCEYAHQKGDIDLFRAILLGSVCMMRRGEICALTVSDIDFEHNTIRVNKSQVRTADGRYEIKPPKTESSNRVIVAPKVVMLNMPHEGDRVVNLNCEDLTKRFGRLVRHYLDKPFRFHDLRHYGASILATGAAGISVEAIKARGGWATDSMMKRVYINQIGKEIDRETVAINEFFDKRVFGEHFWQ